jgi:hypothetical protein
VVFDGLSEVRLLSGDPLRYGRQILSLKDHGKAAFAAAQAPFAPTIRSLDALELRDLTRTGAIGDSGQVSVSLTTRAEAGWALIEVRDNGIGSPPIDSRMCSLRSVEQCLAKHVIKDETRQNLESRPPQISVRLAPYATVAMWSVAAQLDAPHALD